MDLDVSERTVRL